MPERIFCFLTAAALAIGMIACGGSSGGGDGFTPQPPVDELPITPANAAGITADVIDAVTTLFDLIEITNVADLPLPDTLVAKAGLGISSGKPFAGFSESFLSGQDTFWPRSVFVETNDCDSGSFTKTWDDADGDLEMSSGDTLDVSFADCYMIDPDLTLAGSTYISSISMSGDVFNAIPPWSFGANFAFIDLVGTDGEGSVTINGNFDIAGSSADGLIADLEISGTQLTAVEDGATDTFSNFVVTESIDMVNDSLTIDVSGTMTTDRRNGTVNITTPTSLVVLGGDTYPSTGVLLITHATSSVRVIVIDNISVRLAIDADGDGIAETTLTVPWTELDPD